MRFLYCGQMQKTNRLFKYISMFILTIVKFRKSEITSVINQFYQFYIIFRHEIKPVCFRHFARCRGQPCPFRGRPLRRNYTTSNQFEKRFNFTLISRKNFEILLHSHVFKEGFFASANFLIVLNQILS